MTNPSSTPKPNARALRRHNRRISEARNNMRRSAVVATVAVLAAGCSGLDDPDAAGSTASPAAADPAATALAFLEAQADGRYGDAVDLSTLAPEEAACSWLTAAADTGNLISPQAQVDDPATDSGTATAAVTYTRGGSEISTSLDLSGGDGQWRVEWPESYLIDAAFTEPAVAELVIEPPTALELSGGEHQDCTIPASDGQMGAAVFPDSYVATVVDPTGVMDYDLGANLLLHGDEPEVWDLGEPVPDWQLASLQVDLGEARQAGRITCDGALCGADLVDEGGLVLPGELTRVWTDEDESWRGAYTIEGAEFEGTLTRSSDGGLELDLTPAG